MGDVKEIVQNQVEFALQKLCLEDPHLTDRIYKHILNRVVYWEELISHKEKLMFIRLFSPTIYREEVFLGNILLNDFLSKTLEQSISESGIGKSTLIANDLENYYYLVRSEFDISYILKEFRAKVESSLPNLFFDEQNEQSGIFGSLETMLDFEKSNVEPFPIFIMPQIFAERLEIAVRNSLMQKINSSPLDRNPTSIIANLAFFYSHYGDEMQSPYLFLARLASQYNILDINSFRLAFNLDEAVLDNEASVKKIIEDSLKQKEGRTFSSIHLRALLKQAVINLGKKVEANPDEWRMPYIRNKFIPHDEKTLVEMLLSGVQLGYTIINSYQKAFNVGCRVCGVRLTEAEDKSILMGQNTHRFHNQSNKQKEKDDAKICLRCALSTYLIVKLMGSEAVGQPQVPKNYNLIFHYGQHTDDDITRLAKRIDFIWDLLYNHRDIEFIRRGIEDQRKKLTQKAERESNIRKKQTIASEITQIERELQQKQFEREQIQEKIFAELSRKRETEASLAPTENPSLDILANIQRPQTKVEKHIIGLGIGGYRMVLFVLPQIRPPHDAKEHDFAQRRFSNSRVTVFALLSFLRDTCGCNGPFYFQSLPSLTSDTFKTDTFYVHNEPINVSETQSQYEIIAQYAWRLIRQTGSDGFVKKVLLAEKFLVDPLATFSTIMRDSPILGQTKGSYKRLKGKYRQDWKAEDLTEYARFIKQFMKIQEVKHGSTN